MQSFDNVRGGVQLDSVGDDSSDNMKLFAQHDEDIKEGPDHARVLMNNHKN